MFPSAPPFYVITGGPGSGKTTLLAELARRGHICVAEDARALIQEQVKNSGDALPWANVPRYAELLLLRSIATWHEHAADTIATPRYFDRAVGDALGYAEHIGLSLPRQLLTQAHACRYRSPVFLAPWWPEIYHTDQERRQTAEEAARTQHACAKAYTDLGYAVLLLPLVSPAERADCVLRNSAL